MIGGADLGSSPYPERYSYRPAARVRSCHCSRRVNRRDADIRLASDDRPVDGTLPVGRSRGAILQNHDAIVPPMMRPLHPSTAELRETGRRLRQQTPRSSLATLSTGHRDPLGILAEQNGTRLQELIPLRVERMSQSAFAFYRGTAGLMAADLADCPTTGVQVASCGDAHVANFGFYASPQRTLVFDLNDFDEAASAPWEWDVKRLVTSVVVGGRDDSRNTEVIEKAARGAVLAYRGALRASLDHSPLERYYTHIEAEGGAGLLDKKSRRAVHKAIGDAQKRTGDRAVRRLTTTDPDGTLRFIERSPTMGPMDPLQVALVRQHIEAYERSTAPDVRAVLSHYSEVDTARRVVGVGSVGTRCALVLFQDGDGNGLIMQSKEAGRSVLEQYGGITQPDVLTELVAEHGQGARVVSFQRILQAVSDPFLGYLRTDEFDLYVRQFHDMKGGIDVGELEDRPFITYAAACGVALARAHSQSPRAAIVAGYLGTGRAVADAILEWSMAYADLSEQDYRAFLAGAR